MKYNSIKPGKLWLDTSGKPIQAHGFQIFYDEADSSYYWYGENKEFSKKRSSIWTYGIRCYKSKDFYNWEDLGLIIPPSNDKTKAMYPNHQLDRPHIIYCAKTKKYVCWIKVMVDRINQVMTILESDSFMGPYKTVHEIYSPLNMNAGDFTLVKDSDKAYIIFERPHFELVCASLSDTYTEVTGEYSTHYTNRKPPYTREAPVYFIKDNKKYLFTSGTSGYFPNPTTVCIIDDFHKEYKDLGNPAINDKTNTTFNSQISCVIKIPNKDLYVALADRWLISPLIPLMNKAIQKGMERTFLNYKPDKTLIDIKEFSTLEKTFTDNTYKSRYVFLPIEFDGDKPVIKFIKEWRLEDYK